MFEKLKIGRNTYEWKTGSLPGGGFQPLDFGMGLPFGGNQPPGDFEGLTQPMQGFPSSGPTESKISPEEKEKRDRAKRASRIYRRICTEAGLSSCFFSDFNTWSEFVEGKMSEGEFSQRAESIVREMAEENLKQREAQSRN